MRILVVNINFDPRTVEGCEAIAAALTALDPGVEVRIRPWRLVLSGSGALAPELARWAPGAVVLGPNETPFPAYPPAFDRFLAWVRARRGPTLGICGGHQAMALAHGAPVAPVHPVPAATASYAGMPKVSGPTRIRLLGDPDPLLEGLPEELVVMSSHVDEVKDLPPGFRVLALGDPSRIQILRADRRPLWGVQFHPEREVRVPDPASGVASPSDDLGAARRVLGNFVAFARAWRSRPRGGDGDAEVDPDAAPPAEAADPSEGAEPTA